jgi:hypothetical protein
MSEHEQTKKLFWNILIFVFCGQKKQKRRFQTRKQSKKDTGAVGGERCGLAGLWNYAREYL